MLQKRANAPASYFLALIVVVLVSASPASAQGDCRARVVGFPVGVEDTDAQPRKITQAELGDRITVKVEVSTDCSKPPATPANEKEQAGADTQSWIPGLTRAEVRKLVPYLDARPLKGVYPEAIDPVSQTVTFHLEGTEDSLDAWKDLLSNPSFKPREMKFSVGLEDKDQLETSAILKLLVLRKKRFLIACAIFLIILYIFFRLAAGTALLRDPGISQGYMPGYSILWRRPSPDTKLGPFSLARTQMAFWFFMVSTAFVLIWMITGNTNSITQGVLVLIGISAGTALGATAIDSAKRKKTTDPLPGKASNGFLNDVLGDDTGISFHRFQIVVWTIVLGFVFSKNVLNQLTMPEFSTNLLTLMGISSGTYLGLKLPEQQAPESPPKPPESTGVAQAGTQSQQGQTNEDGDDKAEQASTDASTTQGQ